MCTWVLILLPSVLQLSFVNPGFDFGIGRIVLQTSYVGTTVACLMALLFTTCSDPGIVPRPLSYRDSASLLPNNDESPSTI